MSEETKVRGKPTSYPALSLSLCLIKAKAMLEAMPKTDKYLSAEDFAMMAGYKGFMHNSAPKGFLAALHHFGLLEKEPKTKGIRFFRGLRHLSWDDRTRKAELVAEAVMRPQKYQMLWKMLSLSEKESLGRAEVETALKADGMSDRPARMMSGFFMDDVALVASLGLNVSNPLAAALEAVAQRKETVDESASVREEITLPSGTKMEIYFDRNPAQDNWIFIGEFSALKAKKRK